MILTQNLVPKLKCAPLFMKFGTLEEIEHANYEYCTWNWRC